MVAPSLKILQNIVDFIQMLSLVSKMKEVWLQIAPWKSLWLEKQHLSTGESGEMLSLISLL